MDLDEVLKEAAAAIMTLFRWEERLKDLFKHFLERCS
jgi:hypothetical protein